MANRQQVTVVARFLAKPGMETRVREEVLALVGPTRSEPGCINYDLHVAADNPARLMLYENWRSQQDLDEHLAKPYLERFKGLAEELLAEPLDIALYDMITETST